jgi:Ca2+-binding RTX toxin-like protein
MATYDASKAASGFDFTTFDLTGEVTPAPNSTTYRLTDKTDPDKDTFTQFEGVLFEDDGTDLTAGTITKITAFKNGGQLYQITGLALEVNDKVANLLANDDAQGFLAEVFSGADVLNGSAFNDHLIGYAGMDKMFGNAGNDTLIGGTGDDTLFGGAGVDTMDGGDGKDTYEVDSDKDVTKDSGADGLADTVLSSVTLAIDDTIENLTLTGAAAINGTGNASNNVLIGNSAANKLDGLAGADTMKGGGGNDTYIVDDVGDVVDETVPGSSGFDTVLSSASDFKLGAGVENLTLTGSGDIDGTGNDLANVIKGNAGDNELFGMGGHDRLEGGAGADKLNGGKGNDTMIGGLGDDVYFVDSVLDQIIEKNGEGIETVVSTVSYVLGDNLNNLTLVENFDLSGTGNGQRNHIVGNDKNNILEGVENFPDDKGVVHGDTLEGGKGDDTYLVWHTVDQVIEEAGEEYGYDIVKSVASFTLGANIEELILTSTVSVDGTGNDLDNKITGNQGENKLSGGAGNDSLNGGVKDGRDTLDGGTGDDTMVGAAGDDLYVVDSLKDVIIESSGADEVRLTGTDLGLVKLYTGIEHYDFSEFGAGPITFTGTTAANRITGTAADDRLFGGSGNDTLNGGVGNDSLDGGKGNDTYVMDVDLDEINDTGNDAGDTVQTATLQIDLTLGNFKGIENVTLTGTDHLNAIGTVAKNILTGNAGDNFLDGNDGNDTLIGGGGKDTLAGGKGSDSMAGGSGNDIYEVDAVGDKVLENVNAGIDLVTSKISYVLGDNLEELVLEGGDLNGKGNTLDNVIVGTDGKNFIDGWFGVDIMRGFGGDDTYVVIEETDQVLEDEDKGTDLVQAWVDYTLADNVDNLLIMGIADFEGTGNKLANVLTGNKGGNKLDGKEGDDTMIGAAGDDIYTMDSLGDKIEEKAGGGADEIIFFDHQSLVKLQSNIEHYNFSQFTTKVTFTGDKLANRITGSNLDGLNGDVLSGDIGNDTLDGGGGDDTLTGGVGNDSYVIDSLLDVANEKDANGKDTGGKDTIVSLFTDFTLDPDVYVNIENLTLGRTDDANGSGNEFANVITGNEFENEMFGLGGNDTIFGSNDSLDGADTLDGGAGNDSLVGGKGGDTYILDSKRDRVVETGPEADADTVVANFSYTLAFRLENLVLTGSENLTGTGNNAGNSITGNDGNNKLDGKANFHVGSDTLTGGKGDDTYYVHVLKGKNTIGDLVFEELDEGIDTVIVDAGALQYALADNVENMTMTGSLTKIGIGNELDNVLIGNAAANKLQGDDGNDTLNGGAGTDTLIGGLADDTYIIDSAKDVIQELGDGIDTIEAKISIDLANYKNFGLDVIENVTLTGSGGLSATGNGFDNHLIGNTGANKLTGGAGNDTLEGGRGNDILDGGDGDDTFLYTSKLDGKDVINNFDGDAADGQDFLDLDRLFDSLDVATDLRDDRVEFNNKGAGVEVRVDVDGNAANGAEFLVATLNTADDIAVGSDVLVGTL